MNVYATTYATTKVATALTPPPSYRAVAWWRNSRWRHGGVAVADVVA
jgi:hypothetical protein